MADSDKGWTRGFFGRLFDRLIGWAYGIAQEKCNYRSVPLRIPISSGISRIELAASLYEPLLPPDKRPDGTILVRSPYGRGLPNSIGFARLFASRGYQILYVSCRGTFGSGGEFDPFCNEVEDGKAVVEWMRKQPWYTGTFATLGISYLGFTQWALLVDPPKDMVAASIMVAPHDFWKGAWGSGSLNLDIVRWANMFAHQEERMGVARKIAGKLVAKWTGHDKFGPVLESVPLVQGVTEALAGKAPWLEPTMTTANPHDLFYARRKLDRALECTNVPIHLVGGWHDLFLQQTLEQYHCLHERGCDVSLTIGPWDHNGCAFSSVPMRQMFHLVDSHLARKTTTEQTHPVQYYVTGVKEWRTESKFPPPTVPRTLYLCSGNRLQHKNTSSGACTSTFVFDPSNPTPAVGGHLLRGKSGSVNDTALSARSDVLSFTTDLLEFDVEFIGRPIITLYHETDSPHADLFVRISEVDANGRSRNICETYQRLDPKRNMDDAIELSIRWCAHRFVKGKRIRVLLAGGSHPHYARNLGVHDPCNRGSEMKAVQHTVYSGVMKPSRLTLPISGCD